MKGVRQTLIDVFSQQPVVAIDADMQHLYRAFNVTDFDALKALPNYEEEYKCAREAKVKIERIAETYDNVGDQALQCLAWLRNLRDKSVYETSEYIVARGLLTRTLQFKWNKPDLDKFEQRRAMLDQWSDIFISYTNRDALATNNRYRTLIRHELGWPGESQAQKANYLARVLAKFFEQESIRGFIDFKNLVCGDDIEAAVLDHCAKTFAFVQLVEHDTLIEAKPPLNNWCYREYLEFVGANLPVAVPAKLGNRCFFLLAGSQILAKPAGMGTDSDYNPWFQKMNAKLHLVIDLYKQRPPDQLRNEITGIARQIVATRSQIVDSMLSMW